MILRDNGEKKEFEPVSTGLHNAVCFGNWDILHQKREYEGAVTYPRQTIVGFEVEETLFNFLSK